MRDDREARGGKQASVFLGIEAAMIERIALQFADRFASGISAGEHQGGSGCGMCLEARDHVSLILWREVEETVPSEQPREPLFKGEVSHIGKLRCDAGQVALELR